MALRRLKPEHAAFPRDVRRLDQIGIHDVMARLLESERFRGPRGERGAEGERGERGEVGAIGPQGERGEKGMQGPRGAQGVRGDKGLRGFQGIQGARGERGAEGERGLIGPQGPVGPMGPRGEKGDKGPRGDRGEKGQKGDKGDRGPVPRHEWNGTDLRFEQPDGNWGQWVNLTGSVSYIVNPSSSSVEYAERAGSAEAIKEFRIHQDETPALSLVCAIDDSTVGIADPTTLAAAKVYGLSINGATAGLSAEIITFGRLSHPSFSFNVNDELFLDTSGVIRVGPPPTGFWTRIGKALATNTIFVSIERPVGGA